MLGKYHIDCVPKVQPEVSKIAQNRSVVFGVLGKIKAHFVTCGVFLDFKAESRRYL